MEPDEAYVLKSILYCKYRNAAGIGNFTIIKVTIKYTLWQLK